MFSIVVASGVVIGAVVIYVHKFKVTLKKEIVEPEIKLMKEQFAHGSDIIKEQQIRQDARILKIEKRQEELETAQNEKFDAILTKLGEIADKHATMSGKMEVLLDRFIPSKK